MNTSTILHRISQLKWLFLAVVIALIAYSFIAMPDNLIEIIGLIIFLTGIQLGLDSLVDVERISDKERKRYQDPLYFKIQSRFILFGIFVLVIVTALFISLRFVFPTGNMTLFIAFFNLGIDCLALILGFLCLLKSSYDKYQFAISKDSISE